MCHTISPMGNFRAAKILGRTLLIVVALHVSFSPLGLAAKADGRANVLLITIDTLRADRLSCYGYTKLKTEAIDALAAEGVLFENAFTPIPITLPAHCSILTGTYPFYHGVRDFSGYVLDEKLTTLAEALRASGYITAAFASAAVLDSRFGLRQGFDYYFDDFDLGRALEVGLDSVERKGDETVRAASAWLEKNSNKNFFLWIHLYDPHHPYDPPEPFKTKYKHDPYDGEVAFTDANVAKLMALLKDKGLYQNTLIAVLGDHGEGLGQHGEKTHGFFIYDSTLRVPFILKFPRGEFKGIRVGSQVRLIDLMPTILQYLSLKVPDQVQGKSLLSLVLGRGGELELYSETYLPRFHFAWSELTAIRTSRYKYIDAPRPELYDIAKDPAETRNLYAEQQALANRMRARLRELVSRYASKVNTSPRQVDPQTVERLRSLGYIAIAGDTSIGRGGKRLPDPKDKYHIYEMVTEALNDSQRGNYNAAIQKLILARKAEPQSIVIRHLLASTYQRKGSYPDAIAEFRDAFNLNPKNSLAAYYLGVCYAALNDYDTAISWFRKATELDPQSFLAHYNLGVAYLRRNKVLESIASFKRSIEANPRYPLAHNGLGEVYLHQGSIDDAIAEFKRTIELAPNLLRPYLNLARAYSLKGMEAEARAAYEKAKELSSR